jgi:hypothetical protein
METEKIKSAVREQYGKVAQGEATCGSGPYDGRGLRG